MSLGRGAGNGARNGNGESLGTPSHLTHLPNLGRWTIPQQVAGPGPEAGGPIAGLLSRHRSSDRQPQPMAVVQLSRRASSRAMRSSSSGRQAADKALHSGPDGAGVRREAGQGRPDLVQGEARPAARPG